MKKNQKKIKLYFTTINLFQPIQISLVD